MAQVQGRVIVLLVDAAWHCVCPPPSCHVSLQVCLLQCYSYPTCLLYRGPFRPRSAPFFVGYIVYRSCERFRELLH
jgi:hypothetical protein